MRLPFELCTVMKGPQWDFPNKAILESRRKSDDYRILFHNNINDLIFLPKNWANRNSR
jgi:hypothetical protein